MPPKKPAPETPENASSSRRAHGKAGAAGNEATEPKKTHNSSKKKQEATEQKKIESPAIPPHKSGGKTKKKTQEIISITNSAEPLQDAKSTTRQKRSHKNDGKNPGNEEAEKQAAESPPKRHHRESKEPVVIITTVETNQEISKSQKTASRAKKPKGKTTTTEKGEVAETPNQTKTNTSTKDPVNAQSKTDNKDDIEDEKKNLIKTTKEKEMPKTTNDKPKESAPLVIKEEQIEEKPLNEIAVEQQQIVDVPTEKDNQINDIVHDPAKLVEDPKTSFDQQQNDVQDSNAEKAEIQKIPEIPKVDETIELAKIQKYDSYGFPIPESAQITKKEENLLKAEAKKELEREAKWRIMFERNDWRKLDERVKKGIPNTFRGQAWKMIIDPDSKNQSIVEERPMPDTLYPHLTRDEWKVQYPHWDIIDFDVIRTMPDNIQFTDERVRQSLRNILRAYSVYDKEVGFTQGMAFHAAILLTFMDEKSAYYCFRNLMYSEKYQFRHFFLAGFPRLFEIGEIWKIVLKKGYPKIAQNFENNQIEFSFYGPQWFLSAFLNQPFNPTMKMRLFDRFVNFGSRALLSFGLVIISRHKSIFMSSETDRILDILQHVAESEQMKDWRYVMKKWDQHWIEQKEYLTFFKTAGIEYFP